jgi:hypothetical protein
MRPSVESSQPCREGPSEERSARRENAGVERHATRSPRETGELPEQPSMHAHLNHLLLQYIVTLASFTRSTCIHRTVFDAQLESGTADEHVFRTSTKLFVQ